MIFLCLDPIEGFAVFGHLLDDLGFINNGVVVISLDGGQQRKVSGQVLFLLRHFSKINKGNFVVDQNFQKNFGIFQSRVQREKPPVLLIHQDHAGAIAQWNQKQTSNLPIVDLLCLSKQAADGQAFLFQQDFFFFVCQNQYDSQCGKGKKKEGSQQISCQNQEDTDRQKEGCRNDADDLYKLSISDHICFHTIFPPPFLQTIYLRCNPCQCCQSADDQSGSADQQQNTLPCGFQSFFYQPNDDHRTYQKNSKDIDNQK